MGKRILLVINGTDFGGTETALFQTACRLQGRGYAVQVLSIKATGRIGLLLRQEGVPVASLEMAESVDLMTLFAGCWQLSNWLRLHEFDVLHSFLPRANVMSRVALRLAGRSVPHVSSERSTDLKRSRGVSLLNRLTARWTDRIVAVSPVVRDVLISREGVPASKVTVVDNGIDLDRIDALPATDVRAMLEINQSSCLLCSAGRLVPDKGHVYLIRAMASMAARARVHLILVGEGPEESRLRNEAGRLTLADRIHFMGFRSDLIPILKAVDIFVLPSLEEGIPVAAMEAMACGLPVVATDVGGVAHLIEAPRTGLLVQPAEVWKSNNDAVRTWARTDHSSQTSSAIQELARALDGLVDNMPEARAMGLAGRQRIEKHFDIEQVVTHFEEVYADIEAGTAYA